MVLKSQLFSAPKYLCDPSLCFLSSSPPLFPSPRSFSSSSFYNYDPNQVLCIHCSYSLESPLLSSSFLYSLCSHFLVSLVLSLAFFLELKCTESASIWITPCNADIYIHNTILYNTIIQ